MIGRGMPEAGDYPPNVLAALVAAIDVNDLVDLAAPLPSRVELDYPAERFIGGFVVSRQLWRSRFDRPALIAMTSRLRRGEPLDDDARRWFKQVRASFKHLRFAFFLYSAEHRSPLLLSLVTLMMGELQDAVRVGRARDVRRHATRLQLLLSAPTWRLVVREAGRLVPSDTAGFRDFTLAQIASLRPVLATPSIGAHAFHAARKVVSRQVSFHDDMRTLHPSAAHRAMARWLATLNGLMGRFHDDLVTGHASGAFDYRQGSVALPDDIRTRLAALVDFYLGTSSSYPPSA